MGKKNAPETFQRKADDEEDEETFLQWLGGKFQEKFVENIPSDSIRDLPARYIVPVGVFAYIASSFCFAYFIYVGYVTARKQQFISLDEDDGECSVVSTVVDGTYYGSKKGMWGGVKGFKFTHALYRVDLQHYQNSEEEYTRQMQEYVYPKLLKLSEESSSNDGVLNMLNWMSWEARLRPDQPGDHNVFQMTGNPLIIFDRQYFFGLYAGLEGDCLLEGDSQYNSNDGMMSLQYSYDEFINDPICSAVVTPTNMGFEPTYDFDFFRTKVDVASLITCVAVNLEVLHFEELDIIEDSEITKYVPEFDSKIVLSQRFDFRYPGMDPVLCVEANFLAHATCFLRLGDTLVIPVMNHYGTGTGQPEACNCSVPGHGDDDSNCQIFDFMVGAIFYNSESAFFADEAVPFLNASDIAQLRLLEKYSIEDITRLAYNISYAAIGYGEFLDPVWRAEAYEFCTLDGVGACSVLMFNPYDREINSVSEFYYQVPFPACQDSFMVTDASWRALSTHPPVDLVQEYFACKATVYDALFNSVGIASGNTATFVPILMLFLLPLIYMYLSSSGNLPPKKEYDDEDLQKATKAFATALLRVRDGKVRGMPKGGALITVAAELITSASEVAAYPDSDDDDSDDEVSGRAASFSVGSRKLMGEVYVKKERMEEADSDDEEERPNPSQQKHQNKDNTGFFDNMFASNPMQQQGSQGQDMEMGHVSSKTHKKKIRRKTKTSTRIHILNRTDYSVLQRGVIDGKEAPEVASDILEAFRKAQNVVGLDGADAVFNQAVKGSVDLHKVDLSLLPGIKFTSFFSILHQAAVLHASLMTERSERQVGGTEADKYAYQVGERVYTLRDLQALSQSSVNSNSIQSLGFLPE